MKIISKVLVFILLIIGCLLVLPFSVYIVWWFDQLTVGQAPMATVMIFLAAYLALGLGLAFILTRLTKNCY